MSQLVPIPSPGVPTYFGEEGAPLVVLVHDWYGRLPWLEAYARGLQHQGYRVAVPDLYDGVATIDEAAAAGLMKQLDIATALSVLDETIQLARAQGTQRVGVIGFSLGGWLALLHAQGGAVDAVVAYYATLGASQHGVIPCPVLLQLAESDEWDEGEDPESFVNLLKDHGTPVTEFSYPGTVHSFANATIVAKTNVDAAALAFTRTWQFLRGHLLD